MFRVDATHLSFFLELNVVKLTDNHISMIYSSGVIERSTRVYKDNLNISMSMTYLDYQVV